MIFKLNIEDTLDRLLKQEDTDGDKKLTIEDKGPKGICYPIHHWRRICGKRDVSPFKCIAGTCYRKK